MEATAKYDYDATSDDELGFRKGDQIKVSNILFCFLTQVCTQYKLFIAVCMKNIYMWSIYTE